MSARRAFLVLLVSLLATSSLPATADNVYYAKKKRFKLRFVPEDPGGDKTEGTGVARVELWLSTDEGKSWRMNQVMDKVSEKLKKNPGKKLYFRFEAKYGDGSYWFVFRTKDKAGNWSGPTPQSGARPYQKVVIDSTPPRLEVSNPAEGSKVIGGKNIYVSWQMRDLHPAETPVKIEYRFKQGDKWEVLASNAPYMGTLPLPLPFARHLDARIRVTAADRLGNATTITRKFVILTVPEEEQLAEPKKKPTARKTRRRRPSRGVTDPGPRVLALCARARSLLEEARYEQALRLYMQALALEPRYVPAIFDAGICHYYVKRYRQAWGQFDKAIELDPDNPGLYLRRGHAYFQRGQMPAAMKDLTTAVSLAGTDHLLEIQCLDLIAEIHRTKQAYSKAMAAWQRITHLGDPDHALVRAARRNIERYRGQADKTDKR